SSPETALVEPDQKAGQGDGVEFLRLAHAATFGECRELGEIDGVRGYAVRGQPPFYPQMIEVGIDGGRQLHPVTIGQVPRLTYFSPFARSQPRVKPRRTPPRRARRAGAGGRRTASTLRRREPHRRASRRPWRRRLST